MAAGLRAHASVYLGRWLFGPPPNAVLVKSRRCPGVVSRVDWDLVVADLEDVIDEAICVMTIFLRNQSLWQAELSVRDAPPTRKELRTIEKATLSTVGSARQILFMVRHAARMKIRLTNVERFIALAREVNDKYGPGCELSEEEARAIIPPGLSDGV